MKGGWRADLIGFIAVGGFVVICTLIFTFGIKNAMREMVVTSGATTVTAIYD